MEAWHLFLIGQAVAFPSLAPGSEVRLVSPDLLRVYAIGRLEEGVLALEGDLPPDTEVRVVIFPPDVAPEDAAAALSGATALGARVDQEGRDLRILLPDGERVSLRDQLADQGVLLIVPGEEEPE